MVYPVIPEHKKAIITVENGRYVVSRYIEVAPYRFEVQPATNWEALELLALALVEFGGRRRGCRSLSLPGGPGGAGRLAGHVRRSWCQKILFLCERRCCTPSVSSTAAKPLC